MAYNLPNLTPEQLATPLVVGAIYVHNAWAASKYWRGHALELRSVNETTGFCTVSTWRRKNTCVILISELRARYTLRGKT